MMKGGRKNLKRASEDHKLCLGEGECIMQVVSLRGSNVIEVMDAKGVKSLALFPAKFQKSFWIKRGSFVVVDESGREKALESGSKVTCVVARVLFHDQVRALEKSSDWPDVFRTTENNKPHNQSKRASSGHEEELNSDEDGLPPLQPNLNRNRPVELYSDSDNGYDSGPGS